MHATLELAHRVEHTEIDFCAMAPMSVRRRSRDDRVRRRPGVYGPPGSPVNKVLGLGLGVEVTDEDLDAIEVFYDERGCPVQIELCPLASPDLRRG